MEDVKVVPKNNGWAWVALIDGAKVGSGFTFASEADAYARGLACIAEHKYDGMDSPIACPACGSESGWNSQMCCDCGYEKESKMKTAYTADDLEEIYRKWLHYARENNVDTSTCVEVAEFFESIESEIGKSASKVAYASKKQAAITLDQMDNSNGWEYVYVMPESADGDIFEIAELAEGKWEWLLFKNDDMGGELLAEGETNEFPNAQAALDDFNEFMSGSTLYASKKNAYTVDDIDLDTRWLLNVLKSDGLDGWYYGEGGELYFSPDEHNPSLYEWELMHDDGQTEYGGISLPFEDCVRDFVERNHERFSKTASKKQSLLTGENGIEAVLDGEYCDGYVYIEYDADADEYVFDIDLECWGENGEDSIETSLTTPATWQPANIAMDIIGEAEFEYGDDLGIDWQHLTSQLEYYLPYTKTGSKKESSKKTTSDWELTIYDNGWFSRAYDVNGKSVDIKDIIVNIHDGREAAIIDMDPDGADVEINGQDVRLSWNEIHQDWKNLSWEDWVDGHSRDRLWKRYRKMYPRIASSKKTGSKKMAAVNWDGIELASEVNEFGELVELRCNIWPHDNQASYRIYVNGNGWHSTFTNGFEAEDLFDEVCRIGSEETRIKHTSSKKTAVDYGQHGSVEKYTTHFELEYPVTDFDAAQRYLSEDDMTEYLVNDSRIPQEAQDAVISIDWVLTNEYEGYIELLTKRELDQSELDAISEWVSGQNSDGLGEGFEQQGFAEYTDEQYDIDLRYWEEQEPDESDFEDEEEYEDALAYWEDDAPNEWDYYVMCSFDWRTNDYKFTKVSGKSAKTAGYILFDPETDDSYTIVQHSFGEYEVIDEDGYTCIFSDGEVAELGLKKMYDLDFIDYMMEKYSASDKTATQYSKVYQVGHRSFRYNYDEALLEWICTDAEWLDDGFDDVVDCIGLSRENWEEGPEYWCERYSEEIDDELRFM